MDEETGLIYYGRRYYDPKLGEWINCDPKGFVDGLNLYAFVMNDPLIKVDLYGLYYNFYNPNIEAAQINYQNALIN
ncbi:MAG: RHS repeat-associated core domain-containing protein [Actinobacteria bacterium]|nr:RHS repeat-associated core domain-containing protein [Actinomycetota bacterium]